MFTFSVEDNEFDKLLNEVDDGTLNVDLDETKVSAVGSLTSKKQVPQHWQWRSEAMGHCRQGGLVPGTNSCNCE